MTDRELGTGVIMVEHHQPSWVILKLIGLLIALLILPVLIMLNLLLYLVICRLPFRRSSASRPLPAVSR